MTGCSAVATGAAGPGGTTPPSTADGTAASSRPPGFDAFGSAAAAENGPGPAYWASTGGAAWARQSASPFGPGLPYPVLDVARISGVWMATTRSPDPDIGSAVPATESGLWVSTNAGGTWQRLDTTGAIWHGQQPAQVDRVALLGTVPVVTGQVDGRLAVWIGTPT